MQATHLFQGHENTFSGVRKGGEGRGEGRGGGGVLCCLAHGHGIRGVGLGSGEGGGWLRSRLVGGGGLGDDLKPYETLDNLCCRHEPQVTAMDEASSVGLCLAYVLLLRLAGGPLPNLPPDLQILWDADAL